MRLFCDMIPTRMTLQEEPLMQSIRRIGRFLLAQQKSIGTISLKQRNDFLTDMDFEAERRIRRAIHRIFPTHGFWGEELGRHQSDSKNVWFIDPISSTKNYIHGFPHYAIAVALKHGSAVVFSVVYDPTSDELFIAERGDGAFLNDSPIHTSSVKKISDAVVFVNTDIKGDVNIPKRLRVYELIAPRVSAVRRIGSTALQLCYIACGRADASVDSISDIYSTPAGKLILEEVGGNVTDVNGKSWTIESESILASNGKIHRELIKLLTPRTRRPSNQIVD